jgi:hypothetical protein
MLSFRFSSNSCCQCEVVSTHEASSSLFVGPVELKSFTKPAKQLGFSSLRGE